MRTYRVNILLSDQEHKAVMSLPRKVRAGRLGIIIGQAMGDGQLNPDEPFCIVEVKDAK